MGAPPSAGSNTIFELALAGNQEIGNSWTRASSGVMVAHFTPTTGVLYLDLSHVLRRRRRGCAHRPQLATITPRKVRPKGEALKKTECA